jgi:hypothetical protein
MKHRGFIPTHSEKNSLKRAVDCILSSTARAFRFSPTFAAHSTTTVCRLQGRTATPCPTNSRPGFVARMSRVWIVSFTIIRLM